MQMPSIMKIGKPTKKILLYLSYLLNSEALLRLMVSIKEPQV